MLFGTVSSFSNVVNRITRCILIEPAHTFLPLYGSVYFSVLARTHARTHMFVLFSYHFNKPFHMCFYWFKTIYRHVSKYACEVGHYDKSALGVPNLQNRFLMIFYA